ncbi:prephenate dehydrogenase/arogenate dehydrogenase family protein [Leptospira inadai serovar Lyme]|nr:prephenate dehydrogenase/arogenate dehydrogenase family protein [Leptospira inadai]PNV76367.1 prephenate dehydrogenase/arogenate dehydrogenase family protein [Leptospira inadai serovar Lyme]
MGASLSLALKKKRSGAEVTGIVSSQESKQKGISLGSADHLLTSIEFQNTPNWSSYDLIVFGVPVDTTVELIRTLPKNFSGYMTDMGSTKRDIISAVDSALPYSFKEEPKSNMDTALERSGDSDTWSGKNEVSFSGHRYVSSHPMCGSEESGLEFANADLYENRLCILTRPAGALPEAFSKLESFWRFLGMETIEIPALEHDRILSYVSHSPHLISSIMANWVWENECVQKFTEGSPLPLTGGGFRDMTRIAGSNPKMWAPIFSSNRDEIFKSLQEFRKHLDGIISELDPQKPLDPDHWKSFMEKARVNRDGILKHNNGSKKR